MATPQLGPIARVVAFVAREHYLPTDALSGRAKAKRACHPRHVACWIVRQKYGRSLPVIGREIGGRHHTTILSSLRWVDERRETDTRFREWTDFLLARAP